VVYVILEGTVKIHAAHPHGREVILAVLGPGEIVGELSVVDSLGRSASVMTMEPVTLGGLDRERFWELLRTVPRLTYNLVEIVARRLRLANTQIQSLAVLDVPARLARQLLAFAREYGEPQNGGSIRIPLRLTQGDLGDLVGASRVRVNQVFAEYKRVGYISSDGSHRITVHDAAALEHLST
jgi:CRP/FNR family cyclic AMP-dependent transcriptional regulator